jgi:transcriptional/translational regulatory protein YebC/TACO1
MFRKGAQDAKRSRMFSKLAREITVDDKFEFLKDKEDLKKEIILEECIKKYIKYNINNDN